VAEGADRLCGACTTADAAPADATPKAVTDEISAVERDLAITRDLCIGLGMTGSAPAG
jgi:hypothetical protein